MYSTLPGCLKKLAAECGFPLYVVGGRVRDFISGLPLENSDIDICAPSSADDFCLAAKRCGFTVVAVYKNTGTVKLKYGDGEFEFTSFRTDSYVRGGHVPSGICFTQDILADALRRDFKCNAVYYDINGRKFADPLGGMPQITAKIISTVREPERVFGEDGLRLMRLARIAAQTGFEPTGECLEGARANKGLISDISAERIWAELSAILLADLKYGVKDGHYRGLQILKNIGVLAILLPELALGEGMAQRADFHKYDVLEHSLRCVLYADPQVRTAALLHDVGKPACYLKQGNFYGHEEVGAALAFEILQRLKAPKRTAELVKRLVAAHMYDFRMDARESKVRRFLVQNYDIADQILLIKQADFSACRDDLSASPSVAKLASIRKKMEEEGVPFNLKQLKIKGDDLLRLGFAPADVGRTLNALLDDCAIGAAANDAQKLAFRAVKVYLNKRN